MPPKQPKPQPVTSLADLKPRPAPTGRVRLGGAGPSAPEAPPPEDAPMRLYMVRKETETQTVHVLVRARTRDEAVKMSGYDRVDEVQEMVVEGLPETVWECTIQNVEEDDFFDD